MKFTAALHEFNNSDFTEKALQLFHFQYEGNPLYRQYADMTGVDPGRVRKLSDLPFLPISFFKSHDVATTSFTEEAVFESSGTTGSVNSRHRVKHIGLYRENFLMGFRQFYGDPAQWCIIGLLPSYLERKNSSLVVMVDELVRRSGHNASGFYLYDHERLRETILMLEAKKQPTLLIGVTYALLDFAERFPLRLEHTVVMETGGMKGRREEMTREAVHALLCQRLGVPEVHSEYGMTELLSQAYSPGHGLFTGARTLRVLLREEDDPFMIHEAGERVQSGIINVIDLANIWSCAFIATEDIGRLHPDGRFEVLGRVDHSDIRGCSLMVV